MKLYYFEGDDKLLEYAKGVESMKSVKPFPTCETCPKWKTIECTMSKLLSDTLRNSRHKWAELIYPNSDYFCKDHQDFAGAK